MRTTGQLLSLLDGCLRGNRAGDHPARSEDSMSRKTNDALRQQVIEAVRSFPEANYTEIGEMLGVDKQRVSYYAGPDEEGKGMRVICLRGGAQPHDVASRISLPGSDRF